MAYIGDSCVRIGSPDWFIGDHLVFTPTLGSVFPGSAHIAVNMAARIDANQTQSTDPLDEDIHVEWELLRVPPNSETRITTKNNNRDAFIFIDKVGVYALKVTAISPNSGCSAPAYCILIGQPFTNASEPSQVYDVSWVWNVLPDFWSMVPKKDQLKVETLWRGLQQQSTKDLMDIFNAKDFLSIATVQDRIFKKWRPYRLSFEPSDVLVIFNNREDIPISYTDFRSILLQRRIPISTEMSFSGTLVRSNLLFLDNANLSDSDSGTAIVIHAGGKIIPSVIASTTILGDRIGALLSQKVSEDLTFPIECRVVQQLPSVNELGIICWGNAPYEVESIGTVDNKTLINTVDRIVWDNEAMPYRVQHEGREGFKKIADAVSFKMQLRVEGAYDLGVRSGDTIFYRVYDVGGRYVSRSVAVSACRGSYIAFEIEDVSSLIGGILEDFETEEETIELIRSEILSTFSVRRYTNRWLTLSSRIEFGAGKNYYRSYSLQIENIHRSKILPIDSETLNIIRLSERTERAVIDGNVLFTEGGEQVVLERDPIQYLENLDFYIKSLDESVLNVSTLDDNTLTSSVYNFSECGVEVGDSLLLRHPNLNGEFEVTGVDGNSLKVFPALAAQVAHAKIVFPGNKGQVTKRIVFNQRVPSDVDLLWAETEVVSNAQAIGEHYGNLVGLPLSAWQESFLQNTYKDTLLGLLYARMMSPSLTIVERAVSILSGIPFSPTTAVIKEIDEKHSIIPEFDVNKGRIVLEEIDEEGNRTERFSSFIYNVQTDDTDPEFSGLAFNDSTGKRLKVGDIVQPMQALALGAKVYDLYSGYVDIPLTDVKDRHRFVVKIDVDSAAIYSDEALDFIYSFTLEVKPSYTAFILSLRKLLVDDVIIEEDVFFKLTNRIFDNPYHLRGPANVLDDIYPDIPYNDLPILMPLTTWFPRDGRLRYLGPNSYRLDSPLLGGFIDPSVRFGIVYSDQPWISEGDYVVERSTQSIFSITKVVSDSELELSPYIVKSAKLRSPSLDMSDTAFYVARARKDTIVDATISITEDQRTSFAALGDMANDIGVGDKVGFTSGPLLRITNKFEIAQGSYLYETYPLKPRFISGDQQVRVYREQIVDRILFEGDVTVSLNANQETAFLNLPSSPLYYGIEPGDTVNIGGYSGKVVSSMSTGFIGVAPSVVLPDGLYQAKIERSGANQGFDDLSEHERAIDSSVLFILRSQHIFTISNGVIEDAHGLLRPGDILYNLSDPDTTDYGEGIGMLRVLASVGGSEGFYYTTYSNTYNIVGKFIIIKQAPLGQRYFLSFTDPSSGNVTGPWGKEHWRI